MPTETSENCHFLGVTIVIISLAHKLLGIQTHKYSFFFGNLQGNKILYTGLMVEHRHVSKY